MEILTEVTKTQSSKPQSAIRQSAIRAILCYWREGPQPRAIIQKRKSTGHVPLRGLAHICRFA
eukprot:7212064-Alexandrium_andersonii.AAC.1